MLDKLDDYDYCKVIAQVGDESQLDWDIVVSKSGWFEPPLVCAYCAENLYNLHIVKVILVAKQDTVYKCYFCLNHGPSDIRHVSELLGWLGMMQQAKKYIKKLISNS